MKQEHLENLFVLRTLGDTPTVWRLSLGEAIAFLVMTFLGIFGFPPSPLFWFLFSVIYIFISKKILSKIRAQTFWGLIYWYLPNWITPFKKKRQVGGGLPSSAQRYFLR